MTRERRNAGEHALPTPHDRNRRDMLAAAALQGLLASASTNGETLGEIAALAVDCAELLIEALDGESGE